MQSPNQTHTQAEDCIDRIGCAKYITTLEFEGLPLTPAAIEISAFVTPEGFFQYQVMPFSMKNAPVMFQCMINKVIRDLEGCKAYVVFAGTWEEHLLRIKEFFCQLRTANLTLNLVKNKFAYVIYLGRVVGQSQVRSVTAKVDAINNYAVPTTKRKVMRFLGMAGYYWKFFRDFATMCEPLTNLLKKNTAFVWNGAAQRAIDSVNTLLMSAPVLTMPDFGNPLH